MINAENSTVNPLNALASFQHFNKDDFCKNTYRNVYSRCKLCMQHLVDHLLNKYERQDFCFISENCLKSFTSINSEQKNNLNDTFVSVAKNISY